MCNHDDVITVRVGGGYVLIICKKCKQEHLDLARK